MMILYLFLYYAKSLRARKSYADFAVFDQRIECDNHLKPDLKQYLITTLNVEFNLKDLMAVVEQ